MKLTDYHQIVVVSVMAMLASGYTHFYVFAYLPELVVWMGYEELEKGYYTGILTGCFYIGAFITNYPFGVLADKYGHRNVLMTLLAVNGGVNMMLSFSRDIYTWIVLRFMLGLCHAVFGLSRAIVSLYSDDSNHGIAMAINMVAMRVAFFLASMIGGYFVSLNDSSFFDRFPFFIPPCVGGMLGVIGALTTYCMYPKDNTDFSDVIELCSEDIELCFIDRTQDCPDMEECETLQDEAQDIVTSEHSKTIPKSQVPFYDEECIKHTSHDQIVLLFGENNSNKKGYSTFECDDNTRTIDRVSSGQSSIDVNSSACTKTDLLDPCHFATTNKIEHSTPTNVSPLPRKHNDVNQYQNNTDRTSKVPTIRRKVLLMDGEDKTNTDTTPNGKTMKTDKTPNKALVKSWSTIKQHVAKFINFLKDITIVRICVGGMFMIAGGTALDQLFSVWMSTMPDLGGLGYTHSDIGSVYLIISFPTAICTLFFIPVFERRYGAIHACTAGLVVTSVCVSVVPLARFVKSAQAVFALMCVFYAIYLVLLSSSISYSLVILSNCVSKREIGAIHGLGNMVNTVGGAFMPIVGGVVFSSSIVSDLGIPIDPSLAFVVLGSMFWVASILFITLPSSVNYMPKDELGNRM